MNQLICPISTKRMNGWTARLTAVFMAVLLLIALLSQSVLLLGFVAADYLIRAFDLLPYSPASWLATHLHEAVGLTPHQIDKAPKLFAARVGFLFACTATLLLLLSPTVGLIVAGILLLFATLEAAVDLCMGCIVYTYVVLPLFGHN